jgi:transglutaminase-like putative cysteine protease
MTSWKDGGLTPWHSPGKTFRLNLTVQIGEPARGKGVCQHYDYAVIFTAVARALKIPTRINAGYLMTDGYSGVHA